VVVVRTKADLDVPCLWGLTRGSGSKWVITVLSPRYREFVAKYSFRQSDESPWRFINGSTMEARVRKSLSAEDSWGKPGAVA
jgi:hypothetical protein